MLHAIIITSIITCIYGETSLHVLVPVNAQTNDLPAALANDLAAAPANAMTNDLPVAPVRILDIVNSTSMIGNLMTNPHALVSLMANEDPGKIDEVVLILKGLIGVSETGIASFNKDESDAEQEKLAAAGIHEDLVSSVTNLTNWLASETTERNTAKMSYDNAFQVHAQKETLKNREVPALERSNQAIEDAIALLEELKQLRVAANVGPPPELLGDNCGGFRESTCGDVFFAAMVSTTWNTTFNYRCPDDFRWITSDEYTESVGQSSSCTNTFIYHGQCGWNRYIWGGEARNWFRFSDSTVANGLSLHAGEYDSSAIRTGDSTVANGFAGIVCMAE